MKNLLFQLCCILLSFTAFANQGDDKSQAPYFFIQSEKPSGLETLPLKATRADVDIAGVIADVRIEQTYVNTGETPIEAIYIFPGSTQAAVYGLRMEVGARCIIAKIQERNQARQTYETAKSEGKRASLLEQHRPNVFQMNVSNIMPGDTIKVTLLYTELLVPEAGNYAFVFPSVVGPRYGGTPNKQTDGSSISNTALYEKAAKTPETAFDIKVHLAAGMPIQDIQCNSHQVQFVNRSEDEIDINLAQSSPKNGTKDFILSYNLQGETVQTGLLLFDDGDEKFFLCMAQPPKSLEKFETLPREYIFVVDVSGSMNGFPLNVSKKLLRNLIGGLQPNDRFNVLLFAGTSNILAENSLLADAKNIEEACAFIDRQDGGGGTELLSALQGALALPRNDVNLSRSIVVVTDGYISFESEAFDLIRNNLNQSNLYAFGIGSSVNRHLIEGMAKVGQGTPFIITEEKEAAPIAERFRQYIASPVMTQLKAKFKGIEAYDLEPNSLADVLADRPIIFFGKYKGAATGALQITGYQGQVKNSSFFNKAKQWFTGKNTDALKIKMDFSTAASSERNKAIKYLWARERVRHLSDYQNIAYNENHKEAITALGLKYNLLTKYTSFVAVDERPVNATGGSKAVHQALPLPSGVSDMAVGFELGFEGISGLMDPAIRIPAYLVWLFLGLLAMGLGFVFRESLKGKLPLFLLAFALWGTACTKETPDKSSTDSITFLLGEDKSDSNPYFKQAKSFFENHPTEGTAEIVSGCRHLEDVRDYLQKTVPEQGAWKTINIVVHGNQWTGINAALDAEKPRITSEGLIEKIKQGRWKKIKNSAISADTEIRLHGCNLGRDTALLKAFSQAFGNAEGDYPLVRSTRYSTLFAPENEYSSKMVRYLGDFQFMHYPAGPYPGDANIAAALRENYPEEDANWRLLLLQTEARSPFSPRVHFFNIPAKWTRLYATENERPLLKTDAEKAAWVQSEPGLLRQIQVAGFSVSDFRWEMESIDFPITAGQSQPALAVEGQLVLYGILSPFCEMQHGQPVPLTPSFLDGKYYVGVRHGSAAL